MRRTPPGCLSPVAGCFSGRWRESLSSSFYFCCSHFPSHQNPLVVRALSHSFPPSLRCLSTSLPRHLFWPGPCGLLQLLSLSSHLEFHFPQVLAAVPTMELSSALRSGYMRNPAGTCPALRHCRHWATESVPAFGLLSLAGLHQPPGVKGR